MSRVSKQQRAKIDQNYRVVSNMCRNCEHYKSDIVDFKYMIYEWTEEISKRCSLGGFKVNKTATCDKHKLKDN